jgi:hypothetical protein
MKIGNSRLRGALIFVLITTSCNALRSYAGSTTGAQSLRDSLVRLAEKKAWPAYTYPSASRQNMPVLALQKADLEAYADVAQDAFALMINRKFGWGHGLIRVGDVVFHMWGVGEGEKTPKVHVLNFRKFMGTSKTTEWYEAVQSPIAANDVSLLQQFFFYRAAIAELHRKESPWWRDFVDKGQPNSVRVENCAGFVLSPFNPRFLANNPSVDELRELLKKAQKMARAANSAVEFFAPETFLREIQALPRRYQMDMLVSSPQSLMRLANSNETTAAFVIHNSKQKDFVSGHKMGFSAKAGGTAKTSLGVDERKRERKPIAGSCERKLAS